MPPPSSEGKIVLDNYYGPLDLLLHLVKEDEVDITAITLARACEQYIAFLSAMEKLDIDLSGDFLSLASQLLLIKSRTLAPAELAPGEEPPPEEEEDVSADLVRKLLEFKRFKDRARLLASLADERARRHGRPRILLEGETDQEPLRNLELWDLVLLFSRVAKSTRLEPTPSILYRDIPLEVFIEKILGELTGRRSTTLSRLVSDPRDRSEVIGTFLALLELTKERRVRIQQDGDAADIRVELAEEPPPADPVGPPSPPPAAAPGPGPDPAGNPGPAPV